MPGYPGPLNLAFCPGFSVESSLSTYTIGGHQIDLHSKIVLTNQCIDTQFVTHWTIVHEARIYILTLEDKVPSCSWQDWAIWSVVFRAQKVFVRELHPSFRCLGFNEARQNHPSSIASTVWKQAWRCRDLNPGPLTCEASALPLSYIPRAPFRQFLNLQSSMMPIHIGFRRAQF